MPRQLWIADRAREWGLTVVEVDGWRERGSASFKPAGVVCHHTAGSSKGDMPSLRLLITGRKDCPGPLCNVGLARSGTVYVIAAGRANHAGSGGWRGLTGNSSVFGIEAENTGTGEPWPEIQVRAYHRLVAALVSGMGGRADLVCGHREWAPQRKIDPKDVDMDAFRTTIGELLGGGPPSRPPATTAGSESDRIAELQSLLGMTADGVWSDTTVKACAEAMIGWPRYVSEHEPDLVDDLRGNSNAGLVRWLQRQGNRRFAYNLAEDGEIGPATNHLIVVGLGQRDGVCGPLGFREAVR